jgi:hypothetical protein
MKKQGGMADSALGARPGSAIVLNTGLGAPESLAVRNR